MDYNYRNWNLEKVHEIVDKYSRFFEEPVDQIHRCFDELERRERFAVEIDFGEWKKGVAPKKAFDFKKELSKAGLDCGFCQFFFTIIVSPFPSVVKILCYVAIPRWENDVIRGLLFGYNKKEVYKFLDQFDKNKRLSEGYKQTCFEEIK